MITNENGQAPTLRTSDSIDQIAAALVAFQAEVQPVAKDAVNPHLKNKYASLDAILEAIRPLLAKHGLAVIQGPTGQPGAGGCVGMVTRVVHTSGQWYESEITIPIGEVGRGRNLAQEVGSSITYLRRYGLAPALGITVDEDTDGSGSARPPAQSSRRPQNGSKPASEGSNKAPEKGNETEKKAYWESLGPNEKKSYKSWPGARAAIGSLGRYDGQPAITGVINKLFTGFEKNGYPTRQDEEHGKIRVGVYRTVKAYVELREQGLDGDEAKAQAWTLAKNVARS